MVRVSSTQPASPEVEEALIINDTKPDRSNAKPQLQIRAGVRTQEDLLGHLVEYKTGKSMKLTLHADEETAQLRVAGRAAGWGRHVAALDRRLAGWAEGAGVRAEGQFGFRRKRSCAQAALVLRAPIERCRSRRQPLYAAFIDFQKAYDTVPRHLLWAPGLAMAAAARPVVSGGAGRSTPLSEPELQHLRFLRRLLALPRSTPAATILAEAGQPPLHARWLRQAARLWNSLVTAPEGSMPRLVVQAAAAVAVDCADVPPQRQPWAAQLAHSLRAVGLTFEPLHMDKISPDGTQQATLRLHLARVTQETPAHTRLRHYFCDVRPECCSLDGYGRPPYVTEVRERRCRRGLTELRTGMHWGAEEQGRRTGTPREQRVCPHCPALDGPGGIEDTRHILFVCPLYAAERERWPELFHEFLGLPPASVPLSAFFQQSNTELAALAAACRKKARDAVSPQ